MTRLPLASSRAEAEANLAEMTEASRFSPPAQCSAAERRVKAVARRFAHNLCDAIGLPKLIEVVRLNATPEYGQGCCASHDFCDANIFMDAAIRDALDVETLDLGNAETNSLWNQAWALAIEQGFYVEQMTKFQVGTTYTDRAAGDHTMIYRWKVIARTPKSLTLRNMNRTVDETFRRGVRVCEGVERCSPNGRYSMAPVISADRWED